MNDSQSAFLLKGKVALITGAATGIGRAIAKAYAAAGADVVIDYAPDQASPDDLLAEITANAQGRAVAVQVDVSDVTKHAQLLETAITHFAPARHPREQRGAKRQNALGKR